MDNFMLGFLIMIGLFALGSDIKSGLKDIADAYRFKR